MRVQPSGSTDLLTPRGFQAEWEAWAARLGRVVLCATGIFLCWLVLAGTAHAEDHLEPDRSDQVSSATVSGVDQAPSPAQGQQAPEQGQAGEGAEREVRKSADTAPGEFEKVSLPQPDLPRTGVDPVDGTVELAGAAVADAVGPALPTDPKSPSVADGRSVHSGQMVSGDTADALTAGTDADGFECIELGTSAGDQNGGGNHAGDTPQPMPVPVSPAPSTAAASSGTVVGPVDAVAWLGFVPLLLTTRAHGFLALTRARAAEPSVSPD